MSGNRYPTMDKRFDKFYDHTSKATIMEIAVSFAVHLTGNEDMEEAIKLMKREKELLK